MGRGSEERKELRSPPETFLHHSDAVDAEKEALRAEKAEWRVQYLEGCVKEWKRQNKQLRMVVEEQAAELEELQAEREAALPPIRHPPDTHHTLFHCSHHCISVCVLWTEWRHI